MSEDWRDSDTSADDAAAAFTTLMPGDDLFPAAGELGLAGEVERRLAMKRPGLYARLLGSLAGAARQSSEARVARLQAIEAQAPEDFDAFLSILYLCYYETDPVHAAINAMGKRYHAAPQPEGYALPAFQPADAPSRGAGWFLRTDEVRPVVVPAGLRASS